MSTATALPPAAAETQAARRRALVARLEEQAERAPGGYLFRVGALATLGYAYVLGVVVLPLVAVAYCAFGRPALVWLEVVLLPLLVAAVHAVAVPGRAPQGLPLPPDRAPELSAMVDEVRASLKAPPIDAIFVSPELEVGVVQSPFLGPFGPVTNYLVVGMPVLQCLDPDELRAVLAHEFGHVSHLDDRIGGWIHRLRITWPGLAAAFAERRSSRLLMRRFMSWYVPYFDAYTLVWARASELRADDVATVAVGAPLLARTLAKLTLMGRFLEQTFWPHVYGHASTRPEPPQDVFQVLGTSLGSVDRWADHGAWRADLCRAPAAPDSPYPSFAARVEALGCVPADSAEAARFQDGPSAAVRYLGSTAEELARQLSTVWAAAATPAWTERHASASLGSSLG